MSDFTLSVLNRKIAFSTLVQYAGKFLQLVLGALAIRTISRFLSTEDFGIYSAITEYALFFSVAANLGIFANVVRSMADDPQNGKIFVNSLFLRIVSAFSFFILGVVILLFTGNSGVFLIGTMLFLSSLLFDYITSVCDGMLQANYMMGRATFALIAGRILNLGCIFAIVRFAESSTINFQIFLLFFAGAILASLVTAALSFYFVSKKIKFEWKIDTAFILQILKISLPFGIINIINNLYFRFLPDYFSHQALSEAQFATFNVSFRISQVASLLSTFLVFSLLPGFKQYIDQKHWINAKKIYRRIQLFLLGSGVLLVVFGSLLGPFLIELLTHEKYFLPEFWFVLPLMLVLAAISYGYDLILITLFAFEFDRWLLKVEFLALSFAFLFFGGSFLIEDLNLKLFCIIAGAIVGESTMVILGSLKVRKIFDSKFGHNGSLGP